MGSYGDAPLLCIDLSAGSDGDLEAGLTFSLDASTASNRMSFHTIIGGSQVGDPLLTGGLTVSDLATRLRVHRHFVLPLVKRSQRSMSMDRIVVGRARNNDVVLRHASVSKFHAWFECLADGVVRVADAGSTNGTKLNGERLEPKTLVEVAHGSPLIFGRVTTFVCDPMLLWEVFH